MAAGGESSFSTRNDTEIWLLGQPIDAIGRQKLPSKGDVLRRLFSLLRTDKKTVREASSVVVREVMRLWEMARIPAIMDYNAIAKVEKEYDKWRALQKGSSRRSKPQIDKEQAFTIDLDNLFDVAHVDALVLLTIEEDRLFLLAQRERGRRGYMSGVDHVLSQQESRREIQRQVQQRKICREQERIHAAADVIELASSNSSDDEVQPIRTGSRNRKRGRKAIVTEDVASALDRTQISDRKAVYVLSAAAASLGHSTDELAINRSTIRRTRIKTRERIAASIKQSFTVDIPLIVHWDGKLLPDVTGTDKVDRLPVLVSGGEMSKLLGVPRLPSGTGKAMADAIVGCLDDWNIRDRVQALSFDTTSSNTGVNNGACTLVEKLIGRDLIHLACRHHMMEIVAEKVFAACNIPSTGPDILLFKRFKDHWQFIDQDRFEVSTNDIADHDEIISFCTMHLAIVQPRDDYRELLELSLIFLGGTPSRGIRFMQPGALHRARWMARVIYAIKLCLFRSQFHMTKQEEASINRFACFGVSLYIRSWFEAPRAAAAPANDLAWLKQLTNYSDKIIADAAVKAFSRHLWYLSESLVSLSFFDSDTSLAIKREMVKALDKTADSAGQPLKRINIDVSASTFNDTTVANFVTSRSYQFFTAFSLPTEFLQTDPSEWETRGDFQKAAQYVVSMKVVNDYAERGVALMQSYNNILTKNEEQRQYILQVVEQHRQQHPIARK